MAFGIVTILHVAAIVLSIIELGLTAYGTKIILDVDADSPFQNNSPRRPSGVSAYYGPFGGRSPDPLNFMLFNAIWSLLVLAYLGLTPLYLAHLFHRIVALALLVVTVIFWFAGSIALAVFLGTPYMCSQNSWCGSIQAAIAFGFFLWAIFTALLVMEILAFSRSRNSATADPHAPHQKTQPYVGA